LQPPEDDWEKVTSADGPFLLTSDEGVANSTEVTVTLRDLDADLDAFNGARYALPGTYVVDVIAYYRMNPTVSHTIRLEVEVLRVEGLETILAGTNNLGAVPGDFASFSLSVLNTGNGDTVYQISCETPNRWSIELGTGNSSTLTLEPLARLQFIPVPVRVRVPYIVNGLPSAGTVEDVTCVTSSLDDPSKSTTESPANGVEVWVSRAFSADLYDGNGDPLGPAGFIDDISVENEERIEHTLVVENRGNIEIDFSVRASPAIPTWNLEMTAGSLVDDRFLEFTLQPGTSLTIDIVVLVPNNANDGDTNQIDFRTELEDSGFQVNRTRLIVQEIADMAIHLPESGSITASIGDYGLAEISLENIGNVDLLLSWSFGTLPDGWQVGFASTAPGGLVNGGDASVIVSLSVAPGTPPGPSGTLSVIIDAETMDGNTQFQKVAELGIIVEPSLWLTFDTDTRIQLSQGRPIIGNLSVTNSGNIACDVTLLFDAPSGLEIIMENEALEAMAIGESRVVSFTLSSEDLRGLQTVTFSGHATPLTGESLSSGNDSATLEVMISGDGESDGVAGFLESLGLPPWSMAILALLIVAMLGFTILRLRRTDPAITWGEELLSPGEILGAQASRREAALNIGPSADDHTSGSVSATELATALSQSSPTSLPPLTGGHTPQPSAPTALPEGLPPESIASPPPLLPSGLPPGWTMDQWKHYGHEYLKRTGQS